MVHHIVMWKFRPEIEEARKPEIKAAMKENLTALVGKVPGLLRVLSPFSVVVRLYPLLQIIGPAGVERSVAAFNNICIIHKQHHRYFIPSVRIWQS